MTVTMPVWMRDGLEVVVARTEKSSPVEVITGKPVKVSTAFGKVRSFDPNVGEVLVDIDAEQTIGIGDAYILATWDGKSWGNSFMVAPREDARFSGKDLSTIHEELVGLVISSLPPHVQAMIARAKKMADKRG